MAFLFPRPIKKQQKMLLGKKLRQLEDPPRALCPDGACIPRIPDNHNLSPPETVLLEHQVSSG
jgi:hypothetical protein